MEKYKKEKMNKIMNLHMKKNLSYAPRHHGTVKLHE